ncbi:glycoside hydrolase family 16 [Coraliomargarita akajimensis DSM 45221]|uniref:Glycoside hydrolase family 16 n=2 Tax=Coraliomargarita TaxID=442430 RepID=D5EKZ8_CORAD|nr:glycoside hydrolase family 16 [Coraliomargarita akajimensis DSM 45221]
MTHILKGSCASFRNLLALWLVLASLFVTLSSHALPPAPSGKQWVQNSTLSDEFNGSSLNTSKWQYNHPYWAGRVPSHFKASNVTVSGGLLRLKATSRINDMNQVNDPVKDVWVDSSCVTSKAKSLKLGMYTEARMKMSRLSMTTAFWSQGNYSEIDCIENIGAPSNPQWAHMSKLMEMNSHYFINGWNNDISTPAHHNMGVNHADAFHVYGFHWKDSRTIDMYLDGVKVKTITTGGGFNENHYMFFDTEVFSWGVGLPLISNLQNNNKNTGFIDWVRTYELENAPPATTLTPGSIVSLKGTNGKFVSSEDGKKTMNCNRSAVGAWEKFTVVDAGNGQVALKGSNNQYVSSENGVSFMNCNRASLGAWEKFTAVDAGNGQIALKGTNNKYVSSENGTKSMNCNRASLGAWEKFTVGQH